MSEPTRDLAAIEAERDQIKLIADPLGELYGSQVL